MTEAEWLASREVPPMLRFLGRKASTRKRRLFACACVRRIWATLADSRSQRAVEVGEAFADGLVERDAVKAAQRGAAAAARKVTRTDVALHHAWTPADAAGNCALLSTEDISTAARAATAASVAGANRSSEVEAQVEILRCIFGNPFRAVAVSRGWVTPAVAALAAAAYDDRVLPSGQLDTHRLAVLSDALEEAGCSDADLLGHLRSVGPHVRGCWALDLILGKQ